MIDRSMPAALFQMHWEHRKTRKSIWYHCATRPEILKPSERTCDAPSIMKVHQLAHRAEICRCGLVSYQDASNGASETPPPMTEATGERLQVRRRVPIADKVKEAVRLRAENRCEDCGRPLAAVKRVRHPAVWADARMRVFEDYRCWKCHKPCTAVLVEFGDVELDPWLTNDAIGRAVTQTFPTFFWDYSRTLNKHYWANHCPRCGAMQGGFFASEYGGEGRTVPLEGFRRKVQDEHAETRVVRWGHFHHKDRNPTNNKLENIALLCVRCHDARHRGNPNSLRSKSDSNNG